ncbi:MAG TPA: DMT family transporter [Candidatus Limnocylindrales bacterium]|nr:DMT family transporter [Candidatus Limnocylindrales bacterium]
MPIGLALGLLASLFWGATDLSGALASRRVGSVGVLAGTQMTSLVLLAVIAILNASLLSASALPGFVIGLALGVVAAAAYLSFYAALRIGPISVVSPVVAAYGGLTVVLAVVFRGESLAPLQGLGAFVATAGIVLTGLELGGSLRETRLVGRGVAIALVTLVLFAVLTILLAGPIKDHGWLPVMLGSRLTNATVGAMLLGVALARRDGPMGSLLGPPGGLTRRALLLVLLAGTCDLVGFVSYTIGLEVAPTWLVGLASSFGPALVVLVAVAFLGERLRPSQWLGLAMLAGGLVLLALAG